MNEKLAFEAEIDTKRAIGQLGLIEAKVREIAKTTAPAHGGGIEPIDSVSFKRSMGEVTTGLGKLKTVQKDFQADLKRGMDALADSQSAKLRTMVTNQTQAFRQLNQEIARAQANVNALALAQGAASRVPSVTQGGALIPVTQGSRAVVPYGAGGALMGQTRALAPGRNEVIHRWAHGHHPNERRGGSVSLLDSMMGVGVGGASMGGGGSGGGLLGGGASALAAGGIGAAIATAGRSLMGALAKSVGLAAAGLRFLGPVGVGTALALGSVPALNDRANRNVAPGTDTGNELVDRTMRNLELQYRDMKREVEGKKDDGKNTAQRILDTIGGFFFGYAAEGKTLDNGPSQPGARDTLPGGGGGVPPKGPSIGPDGLLTPPPGRWTGAPSIESLTREYAAEQAKAVAGEKDEATGDAKGGIWENLKDWFTNNKAVAGLGAGVVGAGAAMALMGGPKMAAMRGLMGRVGGLGSLLGGGGMMYYANRAVASVAEQGVQEADMGTRLAGDQDTEGLFDKIHRRAKFLQFTQLEANSAADALGGQMGSKDLVFDTESSLKFSRALGLSAEHGASMLGGAGRAGVMQQGGVMSFTRQLAAGFDQSKMVGRQTEVTEGMIDVLTDMAGRVGALGEGERSSAIAMLTHLNKSGNPMFQGAAGAQLVKGMGHAFQPGAGGNVVADANFAMAIQSAAVKSGKPLSFVDLNIRREEGASTRNLQALGEHMNSRMKGDSKQMQDARIAYLHDQMGGSLNYTQARDLLKITKNLTDFGDQKAINEIVGEDVLNKQVDKNMDHKNARLARQTAVMADDLRRSVGEALLPTFKLIQTATTTLGKDLMDHAKPAIGEFNGAILELIPTVKEAVGAIADGVATLGGKVAEAVVPSAHAAGALPGVGRLLSGGGNGKFNMAVGHQSVTGHQDALRRMAASGIDMAELEKVSAETGVPVDLLLGVANQESRGDATRIGPKAWDSGYNRWDRARGLMQLMPSTAAGLGLDEANIMDPKKNLRAGAKHLGYLLKKHKGNVRLALAEYNGGGAAVAMSTDPGHEHQRVFENPNNHDPKKPNSYLQTYNYANEIEGGLDEGRVALEGPASSSLRGTGRYQPAPAGVAPGEGLGGIKSLDAWEKSVLARKGTNPKLRAAIMALIRKAEADGIRLDLSSTHRDYATQKALYEDAVRRHGPNQRMVAKPGHSHHNHGVAVDFNQAQPLDPKTYAWMQRHAPEVGLFQPMSWESWHWELAEDPASRGSGDLPHPLAGKPAAARTAAKPPAKPAAKPNGRSATKPAAAPLAPAYKPPAQLAPPGSGLDGAIQNFLRQGAAPASAPAQISQVFYVNGNNPDLDGMRRAAHQGAMDGLAAAEASKRAMWSS
jgi:hypothetical protein